MRKARSLTGLFEWIAVHSDVAEAVSLDRKLYGITKREGACVGERSIARAKPRQANEFAPQTRPAAADGIWPCQVPFSFGIVGHFRSQTVWQYHKREGACVGERSIARAKPWQANEFAPQTRPAAADGIWRSQMPLFTKRKRHPTGCLFSSALFGDSRSLWISNCMAVSQKGGGVCGGTAGSYHT